MRAGGRLVGELVALAEPAANLTAACNSLSLPEPARLRVAGTAGGNTVVDEAIVSTPDAKGTRALKRGSTQS